MSQQPPLPDAAQSPYPLEDAPHDVQEGSEAMQVLKELRAAKQRWAPSARHIGMGAAIGVGSAAIVAGLLYWRGGRR
jgi:hypothetical protein